MLRACRQRQAIRRFQQSRAMAAWWSAITSFANTQQENERLKEELAERDTYIEQLEGEVVALTNEVDRLQKLQKESDVNMPRNMSFSLTTEQFRDRSKTVTRRLGWLQLKAGDIINGCVKCMGFKPGEKIERLGKIRIICVRRERLDAMIRDPLYGDSEARKEGFPLLTGREFVERFCTHMKCKPSTVVTRIEFEYVGA